MKNENLVRLQKFFSDCGIMSRRAAEAEIEKGAVTVNGATAFIGDKINPEKDVVFYNGKRVSPKKEGGHTYILLNKPRGYVTTTRDQVGRKCVLDLIPPECGRVYPVGRLDMVSEGILLLTDDGDLANKLTHPRHEIPKVYRVKVGEQVGKEELAILRSPLMIDGYEILPVEVTMAERNETGTVLKMTLYEGRNRQIRKMCEQAKLTVKRLNRVSIGKLKLNGLPVGRWRYLTEEEIAYLRAAVK